MVLLAALCLDTELRMVVPRATRCAVLTVARGWFMRCGVYGTVWCYAISGTEASHGSTGCAVQQALQAYEKALQCCPRYAEAHNNTGMHCSLPPRGRS
eukprot:2871728-Rhodomonas_salina.1